VADFLGHPVYFMHDSIRDVNHCAFPTKLP